MLVRICLTPNLMDTPTMNADNTKDAHGVFHEGTGSGVRRLLENVSNKKFKKIRATSYKGLLVNIFAKEAKTKKP